MIYDHLIPLHTGKGAMPVKEWAAGLQISDRPRQGADLATRGALPSELEHVLMCVHE